MTDWRGKSIQSLVPACSPLWGFSPYNLFFQGSDWNWFVLGNRQPGINIKDIFFLSSPLTWSLKCVVLPFFQPVPPPSRSHRAAVTHRELSLWWIGVTWVRLSPVEEKCTGRWGRRVISISTISKELMSFSALRLPVLLKRAFHNASFTCKPCKPQPLVCCLPLHRSPSLPHSRCCLCGLWNSHGLVATSREGK